MDFSWPAANNYERTFKVGWKDILGTDFKSITGTIYATNFSCRTLGNEYNISGNQITVLTKSKLIGSWYLDKQEATYYNYADHNNLTPTITMAGSTDPPI